MVNSTPLEATFPDPRVRDPRHAILVSNLKYTEPNLWFLDRFEEQALVFGSAFLEAKRHSIDEDVCIPLYPNDDFFGSSLGGRKELKYQVVYFEPEDSFYFYDYLVNAFCPTSEAKLKLLLSNFMLRAAQDSRGYVHVQNLVVAFRKEEVLDRMITKAKAILVLENSFFEGKKGHRRYIEGKYIEPNEEPAHQQFVKKTIIRDAAAKLTVSDAFSRYHQFCRCNMILPLKRAEFKDLVKEVIREEFKIGLRHDILGDNGKQTHGWDGLACQLEPVSGLN